MRAWSGVLVSGNITATGNSGWLPWPTVALKKNDHYEGLVSGGSLQLTPADLTTDETLDIVIQVSYNAAGDRSRNLHVFTQVTSTNTVAQLHLGAVSTIVAWDTASLSKMALPPYYKVNWTVGGSTPDMSFTLDAALSA